MGFYGNTIAGIPQAFRHIQTYNHGNRGNALITAHQLEDTLTLRGSASLQLVTTPANHTIQFMLQPVNDDGSPINTQHSQKVTTEYGSYILQNQTLATTNEGIISHLEDIYIPIATETKPGLMSASDKANLKTLLSTIDGKTYEVTFYNRLTDELTVINVKENFTIDLNEVPALPASTSEAQVIGWQNAYAEDEIYSDAVSLVNGIGPITQNVFFVLRLRVVGGEDTETARIYFVNTDGTLTIVTGRVGQKMTASMAPEIIDDPNYKIYGWTKDGKEVIRTDEWSGIDIQPVMNFNVLKEGRESASLIAKVRLGTSQYATIRDATALLEGATLDKFGVVKTINTITDPYDLEEGDSLLPDDTEGPVVPDVALATRLASKDQSGWLSKKDKQALDDINFMQGSSSLNFCTHLGSQMPGFVTDHPDNMSWVRINNMVFCKADVRIQVSEKESTNPDFYRHECGLTGFPFEFANKGIINIYVQALNATQTNANKVAKITELVGQYDDAATTNTNIYALFKMFIDDIGQYVIFDNDNANTDDQNNQNRIPALDLQVQFSAMYMAKPLTA